MPSFASTEKPGGPSNNGHAGSGKVNILIVDDRDDKILALESVLGDLGQNIIKARSGKEALRQLLNHEFAVILLDVSMPGMDGFETASLIRQRINSEHTPIIFVTSINDRDNHVAQGYSLGAVDYILTPIVPDILRTKVGVFVDLYKKTEEIKRQAERLRQIEEQEHKRKLAEAIDRLEMETKRNRFFTLSIDLLAKDARSPERLLDESALFLHRNTSKLPDKQRKIIETLHHGVLEGKKVLIVDDDIRNIFAMTSVLERFKMHVVSAEGKDAIETLNNTKDIDVVLMDIMLPTMDGYETMRAIRKNPEFAELPIIAVTAKAMKGDREKCLAAGASDYISKPVDTDQLRSLMSIWLHR